MEKGHTGADNRKALGRGLAALLNTAGPSPSKVDPLANMSAPDGAKIAMPELQNSRLRMVPLAKIEPNPDQPRKYFNEEKLSELALSLKEQGLVQPIIVRSVSGDKFQIIAGERRWRAAKLAGLQEIPVVIREAEKTLSENDLASLVENIQREELNPIELARAYDRVLKAHQFTQESLANKLGVSRVALANTLRLLKLPHPIQELVAAAKISEGHSRALLGLNGERPMVEMAERILKENLSVRDVETRVRSLSVVPNQSTANGAARGSSLVENNIHAVTTEKSPEMLAIEDELRQLFGTKILVRGNGKRGVLEIFYSGSDSFHRLVHQLRALPK